MRIVITGGAGFLGTRLARKLLELGSLTDRARARTGNHLARSPRRRFRARVTRSTGRRDYRRSCGPGGHRARRHDRHRYGLPSCRGRQRTGGGRLRPRHARQSRCHAPVARALPQARRAAEVRVRELAGGLRRAVARSRARRRAADAAGLVRHAKDDRRVPGLRHDAQGIRRRALAAAADGDRAAGKTEPGCVIVCERDHPRAAFRRRRDLPGRAGNAHVGDLAARGRSPTSSLAARRRLPPSRTRAR